MSGPSYRGLVPPGTRLVVPWRQSQRGGTADDRRLREIEVNIPADIAGIEIGTPPGLAGRCDDAVRAVAALDAFHGTRLRPLAALLLRAESIASSKIEHEEASVEEYVRALRGVKANASASSMARATGALDRMTNLAPGDPVDAPAVMEAHRLLMAGDPAEARYAGRWRDQQNWIGGSDYSPRGAIYVPPPPEYVAPKMADLAAFCNRGDLAVLPQAAIAHAQMEAIHPFTDGNGRIGRALASAVLRRRGVTRHVVVPVASALGARRSDYFGALDRYHSGEAAPIVDIVAFSAVVAAEESSTTAQRLDGFPAQWREAVRPRTRSAAAVVLDHLAENPVFSTEELEDGLGASKPTAYRVVAQLHEAGIVRPLTDRTRNQVWGVGSVLDELADLEIRIAARARAEYAPS